MNFLNSISSKIRQGARFLFSAFHKKDGRVNIPVVVVFALAVLAAPVAAHAATSFGDSIIVLLGEVVQFIVELLGKLLIAVIDMLIKVAQYNDFGDSAAVNIGWIVARDIANMLFIIALVVISFGTILQWEQYRYNRLLGKLVITAVIVNFSKAITLFLIDSSQVLMLTFVYAFKDVAAGNLTTGFGIRALLTYANSATSVDINVSETVMVYALALILIIVALVVTLTLVVILIRRIISLWIIIILSPLAFISSVMPGGLGSYNAGWWKRLGSEMFIGPVLAFFLWLSFSIIFLTSGGGTNDTADIIKIGVDGQLIQGTQDQVQAVVSEVGSTKNLFNFAATIILLIHSMSIAREAAGFAGKFAEKASRFIDRGGAATVKGLAGLPGKLAGMTGVTGVAQRAGYAAADKGLAPFQRIPLVGGKIRKARARINEKRDYIDPETTRYIQSQSNEELQRIGNGRVATRSGVVERRSAVEELIRRNKGHYIEKKGMDQYMKSIGYTARIGREDPNDPNSKIVGVEENARYRPGLENVFKARWRMPSHYKSIFPDAKPGSPEQEAIEAEFDSDLHKAKKGDFLDMTLEGLQDPWVTKQVYDEIKLRSDASPKFKEDMRRDATTPLAYVMDHEGRPFPKKESQRAEDAIVREERMRSRMAIADPQIDPSTVADLADQRANQETPIENPNNVEYINLINQRMDGQDVKARQKVAAEYKGFAAGSYFKNEAGEYDAGAYQTALERYRQNQPVQLEAEPEEGEDAETPGEEPRAQARADVSEARLKKFEQAAKIREQAGVGSDTSRLANMIRYAQAKQNNEDESALPLEVVDAGQDIDQRLEKGEKIDDVLGALMKVREEGMDDAQYERERRAIEQYRDIQAREENIPSIVGAKNLASRVQSGITRSEETGQPSFASLAVDFDKLKLRGAGAYASGKQKDALIPDLEKMYRDQLTGDMQEARAAVNQSITAADREMINGRVAEFGASLRGAEKLALANTKRRGMTLPAVQRHERAHAEIEKVAASHPEALTDVFSTIPDDEQKRITNQYADEYGIQALPDDEKREIAMREYLTDGLANYGRTKDAVGGTISDETAFALKAYGAKLRGYQEGTLETSGVGATQGVRRDEILERRDTARNKLEQEEGQLKAMYSGVARDYKINEEIDPDDFKDKLVQKDLRQKYQVPQFKIDELLKRKAGVDEKRRTARISDALEAASRADEAASTVRTTGYSIPAPEETKPISPTPPTPQAPRVSSAVLETQAKQQEQVVRNLQEQYDKQMQAVAQQLPKGVEPHQVTDANPQVQRELSDKGVSDALLQQVRATNSTLQQERKVLTDINLNLRRQRLSDKERTERTDEALREGIREGLQQRSTQDSQEEKNRDSRGDRRMEKQEKPKSTTQKSAPRPSSQPRKAATRPKTTKRPPAESDTQAADDEPV